MYAIELELVGIETGVVPQVPVGSRPSHYYLIAVCKPFIAVDFDGVVVLSVKVGQVVVSSGRNDSFVNRPGTVIGGSAHTIGTRINSRNRRISTGWLRPIYRHPGTIAVHSNPVSRHAEILGDLLVDSNQVLIDDGIAVQSTVGALAFLVKAFEDLVTLAPTVFLAATFRMSAEAPAESGGWPGPYW